MGDENNSKEQLESELQDAQQRITELEGILSDRKELLSGRVEKSVLARLHKEFGFFALGLAILVAFGVLGSFSHIKTSLTESITKAVTTKADEKIAEILRKASDKVDSEIEKVDQILPKIQDDLKAAKDEVERAKFEIDKRLESTIREVKFVGNFLVKDVERSRIEMLDEITEEVKKFKKTSEEAKAQSREILDRVKAEQKILEKATAVIRAQLKEKINILSELSLDKSGHDADLQRYIANVVLKDLQDAELVKRQEVESETKDLISKLLDKDSLRDDYFQEIRFRILRVVSELGLVDIAIKQVSNPDSWERDNLVLILGALRNPRAIAAIVNIIKSKDESVKLREKAVRSLATIVNSIPNFWSVAMPEIIPLKDTLILESVTMEYWPPPDKPYLHRAFWNDPEIESWKPRIPIQYDLIKLHSKDIRIAERTVSKIASSRNESILLRKTAIRLLWVFGGEVSSDTATNVLLNEWKTFGQEAIGSLSKIKNDQATIVLRDFSLKQTVDISLRIKAVEALENMRNKSALEALRHILKNTKEEQVKDAADKAIKRLEKIPFKAPIWLSK